MRGGCELDARARKRLLRIMNRSAAEASAVAYDLSPDVRLALMRQMLKDSEQSSIKAIVGACFAVIGVCLLIADRSMFLWSLVLSLCGASSTLAYTLNELRIHRTLLRLVEAFPDTRLIPLLLDSRPPPDPYLSHILLKKLLPSLRRGDTATWTPAQIEKVVIYLETPLADFDLTVCLLEATERINHPKVFAVVQKLSRLSLKNVILNMPIGRESTTYIENARKVQQLAQDCLPEQILLRASEAPTLTAPETLLRPTQACVSSAPPEQLLRPMEKETE